MMHPGSDPPDADGWQAYGDQPSAEDVTELIRTSIHHDEHSSPGLSQACV